MISLFEYPKGLVFHAHIYYPDVERRNKEEWKKVIQIVYDELKQAIEGD